MGDHAGTTSPVSLTKRDVTLNSPEAATVDMVVRVTGNVIDSRAPGTTIAGLRVEAVKKNGRWLVTDAEFQEPVRAGR